MEIICIIDKYENGNYSIKFENEELILDLLTDDFMEVINIMFNINNDLNIQGLGEFTKKGKLFREEILNKPQYYNIISSDLFIFIYQWFTSLPFHHLDDVLGDKNGEKREQLCSKKLIIMNGKKAIKVTTRNGGRHHPYLIFKSYLKDYYKTGTMTFIDLINNGVPVIKGEINITPLLTNNKIIDKNIIDKVNDNYNINNINDLKFMPYKEYLQTNHWKNVKRKALIRAGNKCQLCSSKLNLNVHHNTYENRGEEKDEDLVVLCENCHSKFHDVLNDNIKKEKIYDKKYIIQQYILSNNIDILDTLKQRLQNENYIRTSEFEKIIKKLNKDFNYELFINSCLEYINGVSISGWDKILNDKYNLPKRSMRIIINKDIIDLEPYNFSKFTFVSKF